MSQVNEGSQEFRASSSMPVSAEELLEWHLRPGAFERLVPPWDGMRVISRTGSIENDSMKLELSVPLPGGLHQTWKIHHEGYVAGRGFDDVMDKGSFSYWRHEHRVKEVGGGVHPSANGKPGTGASTILEDTVHYTPPLGTVGRAVGDRIIRKRLASLFAYRHSVTAGDLAAHARAGLSPQRIAITGATGAIGRALAAYLTTAGHTVIPISRRPLVDLPDADPLGTAEAIIWDPAAGTLDHEQLEGVDAVVHLAGEPIAREQWIPPARWTASRKTAILHSRVDGTATISKAIAACTNGPTVLVCASAIGVFGDRADEELTEAADPGEGYLAEVVKQWEAAAEPARAAGVRTVHTRFGIVLDPRAGALKRLLLPTLMGAGGAMGSGKQWWSWVAVDDVLGIIEYALATPSISGPVNVVAPNAVRQVELAQELGRVMHRPAYITTPVFALRLILGTELANELLIASTHVIPQVLNDSGYVFRYPELEPALCHMLGAARLP